MDEMRRLINLVESAEQQQIDEIDLKKAALTGLTGLSLAGTPDATAQDSDVDMDVKSGEVATCLLYTSPSPRDQRGSRMRAGA